MIKRARFKKSNSVKAEDSDDAEMQNLSDIDEDALDKELELSDVEGGLKNNKYHIMSRSKKGKMRKRLHQQQQQKKEGMMSIVDKHLIHKNDRLRKTRYKVNRQRTLIFASRGVNQRMRHLMEDIRDLVPHSKREPKFRFHHFGPFSL